MSASSGLINRKVLMTFVLGFSSGLVMTYMMFASQQFALHKTIQSRRNLLAEGNFLPSDPHSHGENDNLAGPEEEQNWHDFDLQDHHEHDDDALAKDLYKKVTVLCWVMTNPSNIHTKARHVKATWGKRCNKLLFISSEDEPSLPAVGLKVHEGRDFLWGKTRAAFKYVYDHHFNDADWFMKADDDTYVVLENLRFLLHDCDSAKPLYFGRRFKPYVRQGYMSGGAGYVLSKEAVKRFVEIGLPSPSKCRPDAGGAEDLEMGNCMQNVGVDIGDTRDALSRETFHPFVPEYHLIPGLVPRDNWYWSYNYYTAKEGPDCCSDYAITFHYVPPNMMYVMEYMIYHLKPYGITSKLVLPASQSAALKGETSQSAALKGETSQSAALKGETSQSAALKGETNLSAKTSKQKISADGIQKVKFKSKRTN